MMRGMPVRMTAPTVPIPPWIMAALQRGNNQSWLMYCVTKRLGCLGSSFSTDHPWQNTTLFLAKMLFKT